MIPIVFLLNPKFWMPNNPALRFQPAGGAPMPGMSSPDYKQYLLQLKQRLLTQFKQVEELLSTMDK